MSLEDTAVMETLAAAAEGIATPPETLGNQPETEQVEAPETGEVSEAPETEQSIDPLADLDEAALAESPRVKALLEAKQKELDARHGESLRRTQERLAREAEDRRIEEIARIQQAHAQQVQTGETQRRLERLFREAAEDGKEVSPAEIQRATQELNAFHSLNAVASVTQSFNQQLSRFEKPEIPADLSAEYNRAEARGDVAAMNVLGTRVLESIIRADERAKALVEFEKDITDKAKQETEVETLKSAEKARKAQQGPTSISGSPAPRGMTSAQLNARYTDQQFARLPREERSRLLEEAAEADAHERSKR